MKKIALGLIGFLLCAQSCFGADISKAHTWVDGEIPTAALWNANEDPVYTTINDLDGDNLASDIAITTSGAVTISGTTNLTGTFKIGGTTVSSTAAELNILDDVTADKDELNKMDGCTASTAELNYCDDKINLTSAAEVTGTLPIANVTVSTLVVDGDTAGGVLAGTYPSPAIVSIFKQATYVHDADYYAQTEIVNFSMGDAIVAQTQEFSYLELAVTLTSLGAGDLVDGKTSRQCLDFDGSNDYALIAHDATQAGGAAITLEAWIYRDTAGNTDTILWTQTDHYFRFQITNTNIEAMIVASGGNETISTAHGLSGNGINQWVHVVIAWDNTAKAELYINGVDVGDGDNGSSGTVVDSAAGIYIGAQDDSAAGVTNLFHGKLDGVRILLRKMGATEVLARYNAFK